MHPATLVLLFIIGVFVLAQSAIMLKALQGQTNPDKNVYNFTMLMLFSAIVLILGSAVGLAMTLKGGKGGAAANPTAPSAAAGAASATPGLAAAPAGPNAATIATLLKALGK